MPDDPQVTTSASSPAGPDRVAAGRLRRLGPAGLAAGAAGTIGSEVGVGEFTAGDGTGRAGWFVDAAASRASRLWGSGRRGSSLRKQDCISIQ